MAAKRRQGRPTHKLSKVDRLKRYRKRLEAAKGFRRTEGLDDLWRRMADLYKGQQLPQGMSADDAFVVNVAFATINVMGPSVAINYPKTTVTAMSPEQEDNAIIAEAVIEYWWRRHKVLPPFQRAVKDFLIYGHGWLKQGWKFVEEQDPAAIEEAYEARRTEMDEFAAENPDLAGDLPTDDDILADIEADPDAVQWQIVEDRPFVERISPHDIFVDPEATSIEDMRWIAHRTVKTLDDIDEMYGYKKSVLDGLEPDSGLPEEWFETRRHRFFRDETDFDDVDRYTVWEFYDLITGEMCVFPEQGDKFLVDPVEMPYAYGHPFIMLRNYDVPEQFYPMGELEALEPLQHELNLTRTAMFNDRKTFRRRHLYNPQAFDATGRAALESDEDNVMIPVNGGVPLTDAIIAMPGQAPNPQLYQDSHVIEQDITNVTGINEYMRGALPEIRRTATEAAIIQDTANARASDKLAKVEWAVGEVSRRMLILAQQFLHEGQAARITGRSGRPLHFYFEPSDIQGEFDFEVVGGSTRPKNEQFKQQQAMEMLNALAPFGDPQLGLVNMQEVIAYALEHGFGVDSPERFMGQGPMPMGGLGAPEDVFMPPEEGGMPPDMAQMDPNAQDLLEEGVDPMGAAAQLEGQVGLDLMGNMP